MISIETLLNHGFEAGHPDEEGVSEYQKKISVAGLSAPVRALFNNTDVEDFDEATVWVHATDGIGISVWDCNAHCGAYPFDDPMGLAILREAGIDTKNEGA